MYIALHWNINTSIFATNKVLYFKR